LTHHSTWPMVERSRHHGSAVRRSAVDRVATRTDIVWKAADGHPYNVGVQALGLSRQQVTLGGGF
ncbi:MAG: hypothetical protein M3O46_03315, partial [Myxococcota bacterium]|nr:hypothetical protein [Myxococcota bacterium]